MYHKFYKKEIKSTKTKLNLFNKIKIEKLKNYNQKLNFYNFKLIIWNLRLILKNKKYKF
jgi:hypothetical protein